MTQQQNEQKNPQGMVTAHLRSIRIDIESIYTRIEWMREALMRMEAENYPIEQIESRVSMLEDAIDGVIEELDEEQRKSGLNEIVQELEE